MDGESENSTPYRLWHFQFKYYCSRALTLVGRTRMLGKGRNSFCDCSETFSLIFCQGPDRCLPVGESFHSWLTHEQPRCLWDYLFLMWFANCLPVLYQSLPHCIISTENIRLHSWLLSSHSAASVLWWNAYGSWKNISTANVSADKFRKRCLEDFFVWCLKSICPKNMSTSKFLDLEYL